MFALAGAGFVAFAGDSDDGSDSGATLLLPSAAEPAEAVAAALPDAEADPAKVSAALTPTLSDPRLGSHVTMQVSGRDGADLFSYGVPPGTPASTTKLLTGLAALASLGAEHVFTTTALHDGDRIVLVGGGDPFLSRDRLKVLATETAKALREAGATSVAVDYDTSLFTGPGEAASWKPSYVTTHVVSPISSLWLDDGHTNDAGQAISKVPADQVAAQFGQLLAAAGITVTRGPQEAPAAYGAPILASIQSDDLAQILQRTIERSDNDAAEVLARHVAIARGESADFDGAAKAVVDAVAAQGVSTAGVSLYDGSGLSRSDQIPPVVLTNVLRTADAKPELRALLEALPVAGFTGTMGARFDDSPKGLGVVRAKSGSLNNIRALAGTTTTADGALVYFAILADGITLGSELAAEDALDRVAAALSGCTCR